MPDRKGKLYLFEAIELRNEYDMHIALLQKLIYNDREDYYRTDKDKKEPVEDFNLKEFEKTLKKLITKRVKLNQAIQAANYKFQIEFEGEKISISEALEIRKSMQAEKDAMYQKVIDSAYNTIIHKEERDIVHHPNHSFTKSYEEYKAHIKKLRELINKIHIANHKNIVKFKEE